MHGIGDLARLLQGEGAGARLGGAAGVHPAKGTSEDPRASGNPAPWETTNHEDKGSLPGRAGARESAGLEGTSIGDTMTAGHSGHREKKKARKTIQGVGGGLLIPAQFGVGGEGVGGPQRRAQIHGNQRRRKTEEGLAASIKCYHVGSWRRMQAVSDH